MFGIMLDYSVNIGNLVTIGTVVVSALWFFMTMKSDISLVKKDVKYLQATTVAMTEAFKQLSNVLTQVAVQDTRIALVEKQVDELRHGHGYIKK